MRRAARPGREHERRIIRRIFRAACEPVGVRWPTAPHTVYVSRVADVALLDEFIGPKA